jgi:hypothetical protein
LTPNGAEDAQFLHPPRKISHDEMSGRNRPGEQTFFELPQT